MSAPSKVGAGMLIAGGIAFVIFVLSGLFIIVPLDIILNSLICVGNAFAFKIYKDQEDKLASTASLLLFITEAAWIAFPVIFLVPVALLLLAIHRVKAAHDTPARIAGSILAFVAMGLSLPFLPFVIGLVFGEGFGLSAGAFMTGNIFVTWPMFFVGRDVIPGILLLLGEGGGGTAAREPTYKTYIEATSK
ncbi:MAG: hypothetical protein JW839_08750 [Candidatus Lokiarchaeota archaeon]|nr:hypothetical protein [Candidatus Lokiarchaeota archaeon]